MAPVRLVQCALVVAVAGLLLQIGSPLRLNTDAMILLSTAQSAAAGHGFRDEGYLTVFPPGYPAFVALLLELDLATPSILVAANIAFLLIGIVLAYRVLSSVIAPERLLALIGCAMTLLSFVTIKHATLPVTEPLFFACAMATLAATTTAAQATGRRYVGMLAIAALLAIASLLVRRIGLALIPAVAMSAFAHGRLTALRERGSASRIALVGACSIGMAIVLFVLVRRTFTVGDYGSGAGTDALPAVFMRSVGYRLSELGELFVNVPMSKLPFRLTAVMRAVGAIALALAAFGMTDGSRRWESVDAFLVAYCAVLLVWPFEDARFWLPVAPLLFGYAAIAVKRLSAGRLTTRPCALYCALFAAMGLMALGYSTWISLSGSRFPERFGDGSLRSTYCVADSRCVEGDTAGPVNVRALRLLHTFH